MLAKVKNRIRRAQRVRSKLQGTAQKPRLSVFRSNTHISVQAIDDVNSVTLASANDTAIKKGTKTQKAQSVGEAIAKALLDKKIKTCVFDRGGYLYHGRVKALAEAARSNGITF
ncbi:50S ribosomal protein L18 [Candidatus Gracilibacteria bacterium]|nr:MAG: 50S ribosomal protein L18 [Candidatus Gracilibacteria bacterium]